MDAQITFATLALLVGLALAFDFMNGFHDAANSIATVVSTGVLRPHHAVLWAAFFNFVRSSSSTSRSPRWSARASSIRRRGPLRDLRRAHRRHGLEPDHLVLRDPIQFLARAHRRTDRPQPSPRPARVRCSHPAS